MAADVNEAELQAAAEAVAAVRHQWVLAYGKRPKVMAVDIMMAQAALSASKTLGGANGDTI
jgi:hypothetical protein